MSHLAAGHQSCTANTSRGTPCQSPVRTGRVWCATHDPANAEAMSRARHLGGLHRRSSRGAPVTMPAPHAEALRGIDTLRAVLAEAFQDTLSHERSLLRARTLARLVEVGMRLHEVGEFDQRLAALEVRIGGGAR